MRTTLDLDPAVLTAAKATAHQSGRSVGRVVSEWALRGIHATPAGARAGKSRVPTFDVPFNAPPLDPNKVRELLADEGVPAGR